MANTTPLIPNDRVNSILLQHFMINLRSVYATDGNQSVSGQQSIGVNFANTVLGNIGAPLNGSWVNGADHVDYDEYVILK